MAYCTPGIPAVYGICCVPTGNLYVGSSNDIRNRWAFHESHLRRGIHKNPHMLNAFRKYGAESFLFFIIEHVLDTSTLLVRETALIEHYRALDPHVGFNIAQSTFAPRLGRKHSAESKAKMSAATRASYARGDRKRREPFTDETKRRISAALKGRTLSAGHRARVSATMKGRPLPMKQRLAMAGITEAQVEEIRALVSGGLSMRQAGFRFNVSPGFIRNLINGPSPALRAQWAKWRKRRRWCRETNRFIYDTQEARTG